jgi:hypothetical protein
MGEALALFVQLVRARWREQEWLTGRGGGVPAAAGRGMDAGSGELLRRLSERVRRRSVELAKKAECIARIPASECVTVVQDENQR